MADGTLPLPTRERAHDDARRRMALTFNRGELIWTLAEQFDEHDLAWNIDVVRQGAQGRWVRQRHRYDAQAATLYFLGERALSDEEFRAARTSGTPFDVDAWKG